MRARVCTALSAALAAALALMLSGAGGDLRRPQAAVGTKVDELLIWIGEHSRYDVGHIRASPPTVSFALRGDVIDYEGRALRVGADLVGLYDRDAAEVVLVEPWNPHDPRDIADLLHELVHHVQYLGGARSCWHRSEWEAFKLQEKWLLERGIDPRFNWTYITILSSCLPRDIHPETAAR